MYCLLYDFLPWLVADAILYSLIVYACAEPFLYALAGPSYCRVVIDLLHALIQ
jgi:hypothetical protein